MKKKAVLLIAGPRALPLEFGKKSMAVSTIAIVGPAARKLQIIIAKHITKAE